MPNVLTMPEKPEKFMTLIYGKSGAGKTYSLRTLNELGKVYVFDMDDGMRSLAGSKVDIEYDTYRTLIRNGMIVKDAYLEAKKKLDFLMESCPYQVVVIDSLTFFCDAALSHALKLNNTERTNFDVWNTLISEIQGTLKKLQKLDATVIVIAHEEREKDEITGGLVYRPVVQTKVLAACLPRYFDEMYRVVVSTDAKGETKYSFATASTGTYEAKTILKIPTSVPVNFSTLYKK